MAIPQSNRKTELKEAIVEFTHIEDVKRAEWGYNYNPERWVRENYSLSEEDVIDFMTACDNTKTTLQFVDFSTAKLLKHLGFNWVVVSHFYLREMDKVYIFFDNDSLIDYNTASWKDGKFYTCPTIALAVMWLREVCFIHVELFPLETDGEWSYKLLKILPGKPIETINKGVTSFSTHDKAQQHALTHALKYHETNQSSRNAS